MTMGDKIKMHRIRLGLSQEELGAKLGVNRAAVQKWERGTVENIKRSNIKFLADLFKISPCDLMCWDEQYNTNNRLAEEVNLIEQIQKQYGEEAVQMLQMLQMLNKLGKERVLEDMADLTALSKYTDTDEVLMYRAARSKNHAAPQVMKKSKDRVSKLKKAPNITNSEDL